MAQYLTIITRNMASKAFVRATRPTFLCVGLKNNHCTRKIIVLTDSFTLEELNRYTIS